jgi:hypothetical protein
VTILLRLFALMFKYVPAAKVLWKEVLVVAMGRRSCSRSVSNSRACISERASVGSRTVKKLVKGSELLI